MSTNFISQTTKQLSINVVERSPLKTLQMPGHCGDLTLHGGAWHSQLLSMELASCHPYGTNNSEMAARIFKYLCTTYITWINFWFILIHNCFCVWNSKNGYHTKTGHIFYTFYSLAYTEYVILKNFLRCMLFCNMCTPIPHILNYPHCISVMCYNNSF